MTNWGLVATCAAEPFSPAHVLRIPFAFNGNPWAGTEPPVDLATFDTFEFNVGSVQVEPIESFTVSLFEGSRLLGVIDPLFIRNLDRDSRRIGATGAREATLVAR